MLHRGLGVGKLPQRDLQLVLVLERVAGRQIHAPDEADRRALLADPAGAPGAVQVDGGILGQAVVDDVGQIRDVDPTRGHVGRDEEADLAGLDLLHDLAAPSLGQLARQQLHVEALLVEEGGDGRRVLARVAEDDGGRRVFEIDEVQQRPDLVQPRGGLVEDVIDVVDVVGVGRQPDVLGGGQVVVRKALGLVGDRGAEQQHLAILGGGVEDLGDVLVEAHGEHLVRLVEAGHRRVRQIEVLAPDVVEDPAGRADDDLDPLRQLLLLRAHREPADEHGEVDVLELGDPLALLADLLRQLPGRGEDDGLRLARACLGALDDRHTERCGLSGAGLGAHQHVGAGERGLDGARLDGRGRHVAELGDALEHLRRDGEVGKVTVADVVLARGDVLVLFR